MWPKDMSRTQLKGLQRDLNAFTRRYLKDVTELTVDGELGVATRKRIRQSKYLLGYLRKNTKSTWVDADFRWQLSHPTKARLPAHKGRVKRGRQRRRKHNRAVTFSGWSARFHRGVGTFDGKPVAKWLIPYLQYAREKGWGGSLNSGYRSPAYSEQLCRQICGAPVCPGRCAGRTSNHTKAVPPPAAEGAVDVGDPQGFGVIMRTVPISPKIHNALGARDPWHFSASGR